jgi:hypothetical protein
MGKRRRAKCMGSKLTRIKDFKRINQPKEIKARQNPYISRKPTNVQWNIHRLNLLVQYIMMNTKDYQTLIMTT